MPMIKPKRWSPRALLGVQLPHLFRKPKSAQEWIGPSNEWVPLDAHLRHMYINRKESKFKKEILRLSGVNLRPQGHERKLWSILTAEWVSEGHLKPTQIFPTSLGSLIELETMGSVLLWTGRNGLFLPKPIGRALDDWALTFVPDRSAAQVVRTEGGGAKLLPDYKVRVLDPKNEGLRVPIYPGEGGEELMGRDLAERQLVFKTPARPHSALLYFHCCCAIWKKTCLQNPDITECDDFEFIFLETMKELWGEQVVTGSHRRITDVFKPREEGDNDGIQEMRNSYMEAMSPGGKKGSVKNRTEETRDPFKGIIKYRI